MNAQGEKILHCLQEVAGQRRLRGVDPQLAARVHEVKRFQHERFRQTYADLLADPRYTRAAQFFLDDIYGPEDFVQRDAQFVRIVPGLVRLFPADIVGTVMSLAELHALSERLDTDMGRAIGDGTLGGAEYGRAWRAVAAPAERERQVALMLQVGEALDRYTRNPLLRHSLRVMRGPAQAAGVGALQTFLERGFDTFRELRGAREFLDFVATRERALASKLFDGGDAPAVLSKR
jgi:hypothetical protein